MFFLERKAAPALREPENFCLLAPQVAPVSLNAANA
jgi:hypothetical protein